MNNFDKWKMRFDKQELWEFNNNSNGILWLKVKAICRKNQFDRFLEYSQGKIQITGKKLSEKFYELFTFLEQNKKFIPLLDKFLSSAQNELYATKKINDKQLMADLYKIKSYEWGGDHTNSLDKYLVTHYVKNTSSYQLLEVAKDTIASNVWEYVKASWYNNWTSYLIESIFKSHPGVISAIGEVKSVDFFLGNIPIDLKVTYFPNQYLQEKLKSLLQTSETTWLKRIAKNHNLKIDNALSTHEQTYIIKEKLNELGLTKDIDYLHSQKINIIEKAKNNSQELITWLYSHQGEMRFGSENRIFLILAHKKDLSQSWKLKRNIELLRPQITSYLDSFSTSSLKEINFAFKNKQYKSLADAIFIIS